jgi:hypothetical protein
MNLLNLKFALNLKGNIMNKFNKCSAQGDLYIRKIDVLPSNLKLVKAEKGNLILAHSETGHHHIVAERPNIKLYASENPLVSYLEVIEATDAAETVIEHLRSFDTHAPIGLDSGIYEIRNAREYTPEGWRRVAD